MILDIASSHVVNFAKVGKIRGFSPLELSNMTLVFLPPNGTIIVQPLKDLTCLMLGTTFLIMWSYEVWSELNARMVKNCWRMARI